MLLEEEKGLLKNEGIDKWLRCRGSSAEDAWFEPCYDLFFLSCISELIMPHALQTLHVGQESTSCDEKKWGSYPSVMVLSKSPYHYNFLPYRLLTTEGRENFLSEERLSPNRLKFIQGKLGSMFSC